MLNNQRVSRLWLIPQALPCVLAAPCVRPRFVHEHLLSILTPFAQHVKDLESEVQRDVSIAVWPYGEIWPARRCCYYQARDLTNIEEGFGLNNGGQLYIYIYIVIKYAPIYRHLQGNSGRTWRAWASKYPQTWCIFVHHPQKRAGVETT